MSDEVTRFVVNCLTENGKLERFLEETGTLERIRVDSEEKKARETAQEMIFDGFTPEQIARYVKMPLEWVQSLMR